MMILQFTLIGFVVFGDQLFAALGMQAPGFYADIRDKKLVFGMGTWFLGNMVQSSLNSTGAFEIFFKGSKVIAMCFLCPDVICSVTLGLLRLDTIQTQACTFKVSPPTHLCRVASCTG